MKFSNYFIADLIWWSKMRQQQQLTLTPGRVWREMEITQKKYQVDKIFMNVKLFALLTANEERN
jgi:hypothetical protein